MNDTASALGGAADHGVHNVIYRLLDPTPYYPTIEERIPMSTLHRYAPWIVSIGAHYLGHGPFTTAVALSLVALLTLQAPFYTNGANFEDYAASAQNVWLIIRLLDFHFNKPRYMGTPGSELRKKGGAANGDLKTWKEKIIWALRLQLTPRGVGWNWEVKGIVDSPDVKMSRSSFIKKRALCFIYHFIMQDLAIYTLEFLWTVKPTVTDPVKAVLLRVGIAWCGGITLYQGFGVWDNAIPALTVLIGICDPSEWPPILGTLESSWSVRQFWGASYHQMLRRIFQVPGCKITSVLGLKHGTIASRYVQLYAAFAISSVLHLWGRFSFNRENCGEFRFFMLQAVAITIEDFVQWMWAGVVGPKETRAKGLKIFERIVGYLWTIAAFSYTMYPFAQKMRQVDVIGFGTFDELFVRDVAQRHAVDYLYG